MGKRRESAPGQGSSHLVAQSGEFTHVYGAPRLTPDAAGALIRGGTNPVDYGGFRCIQKVRRFCGRQIHLDSGYRNKVRRSSQLVYRHQRQSVIRLLNDRLDLNVFRHPETNRQCSDLISHGIPPLNDLNYIPANSVRLAAGAQYTTRRKSKIKFPSPGGQLHCDSTSPDSRQAAAERHRDNPQRHGPRAARSLCCRTSGPLWPAPQTPGVSSCR